MNSELLFLSLGGLGEIGMNVYLYGLNGRWMMVDLGISFADERVPGADKILPDLSFIEERRDSLDGIVITHAHEDHIGAVPHLWPSLRCPIYCSQFPAAVLRRKLDEMEGGMPAAIHEVKPGERFEVGPFGCRLIHMTHSIPDASSLAIETPFGQVVHSGDWKLDPAPQIGEPSDLPLLEEIGANGVLALVADSTNVLSPGVAGSEAEVRDSLRKLIAEQPNRVALTTFASNIARLETAIIAGAEAGRQVCVVGRSMHRMLDCAKECGLIDGLPPLLDERDAGELPRERTMLLVTGSQGEPRAALMRIAAGQHPRVKLEPGDTAIFSSKIIPGNERTLYNLHNNLVDQGVEVITEDDHFVHVSGHPCRDEMEQMYRWLKPKIAVPMHGEARHLHAHARLAKSLGVEHTPVLRTGEVLRLAPGEVCVVDNVQYGRKALESSEMLDARDDLYRSRRRLMNHGTILVSIVLDELGTILADPKISPIGACDMATFDRRKTTVALAITEAIEELDDDHIGDDARIDQAVRTAVRQSLALPRFRRPIVEIQTTRLAADIIGGQSDYRMEAAK